MKNYFIESVKCDVANGGMACGPVSGPVVAEALVKDEENSSSYIGLVEVDGMPNFYQSESSYFDSLIDDDMPEESFEEFQSHFIAEGMYEDLFEEPDEDMQDMFRYLIYIVRADWDECEKYIAGTTGKWLGEIEIPMSDVEEEYNYMCDIDE